MSSIQLIDKKLLDTLGQKAKESERKRINHNFHSELSDPINRMLNAMEPDTYCRPHKHENPDKYEVFIVLKGTMAVLLFNDAGEVTQSIKLGPNEDTMGIDIPPTVWHTLISLESGSVAYEVKNGPYKKPIDKNFATWAPTEDDNTAQDYLKHLKNQCK